MNAEYPPPIHDLEALSNLCLAYDAEFVTLIATIHPLDRYGVRVRYPGETASKVEAETAFSTAREVRAMIRRKLGL